MKQEDFKKLMRTPLVYDGRNIFGMECMREAGVEYHSIGRSMGAGRLSTVNTKENDSNEAKLQTAR